LDFCLTWNRSISRRDVVLTISFFNILWMYVSNCWSDNESSNAFKLFISFAPNINIVLWLTHIVSISSQLTTVQSKGHNFYMSSSNEEIFIFMESSHQHLQCQKISKLTKIMTRKYDLRKHYRQPHILPTDHPPF